MGAIVSDINNEIHATITGAQPEGKCHCDAEAKKLGIPAPGDHLETVIRGLE